MNQQTNTHKALIIGAGIAGIAAAIRLRMKGFDVEVFEQNNYPGGKLSDFKLGDFQFDAGPSLFTQPQLVNELFEMADEQIDKHFQYYRLPILL